MFNHRVPPDRESPLPFPPPVNPWREVLRSNSHVVFGALLLLLALMAGAPILFFWLRQLFPALDALLYSLPGPVSALGEILLDVSTLLLPCLLIVYLLNMPMTAAFPRKIPRLRLLIPAIFCCLGMSAVGVLLSGYLQALLAQTVGMIPVMPDQPPPYGAAEALLYLLQLALIPAVLEELLFRGAVLQSLRRFGDGFALIASSFLFACAHGNLVQAPNAMVSGVVLGYFALRSGGLFTPILMHFINNTIAALINLSMLYLPADVFELLNLIIFPVYLALGILGVVVMLRMNRGFIRPFEAEIGMKSGEKYACFFTTPLALLYIGLIGYVMSLHFERIW